MLVRDLMTKDPITALPKDTLAQVREKMFARKIRRLPVLSGNDLVGIISESDIRRCDAPLASTFVEEVMVPDAVTVESSATAEHAVSLLTKNAIGSLPVLEHGKVVGMVSAKDLWIGELHTQPDWIPPKP
jgi:CBS domain-containing protein